MKRNYVLPLIAVLGLAVTILVIISNSVPVEKQSLLTRPPESPYASTIAGVGITETVAGNIEIGTPVSGLVTDVYMKVGDRVTAGDPLFKIDDRSLQAELLTANAQADLAKTSLQKPTHRLEYLRSLRQKDPGAVSAHDLTDLEDDLAQAHASYALANAQVRKIEADIAIRTVRAPADGDILQVRTRVGEYVQAGINTKPIMLFGRKESLNVRVEIDEADIWRYAPGASAVAFVRGNPAQKIALHYEYTERYVVPKTSLTGQSTERTDVRVLQVIYSIASDRLTIYAGQQLDVFIEANPDSERGGSREF